MPESLTPLQRIMQSAPLRPCIVCSRPTNKSCGQCQGAWYCSPGHLQSVRMLLAFAETTVVTPLRIGHAIVNNAFLKVTTTAPSVAQLSLFKQGTNLRYQYLRFYFPIKKVLLFFSCPYFSFKKICTPRPSTHNHCQLPVFIGVSDSTHPESFPRSLPINVDYTRLEGGKIEYASSVMVFSIGIAEPFTC